MPGKTELSFEELADEFAERYRRGERPSLSEYTDRHPQLADRIQRLFPLMAMMEEHQPDEGSTGALDQSNTPRQPQLRSLGDFRILREIGRGGMGIVYEAEQESLGRRVALKVLPFSAALLKNHSQRFLREARAAARLHHTNIVPVFGVGEQEGIHYYVMQFIRGCGLDVVIDELRQLHSKRSNIEPRRPGQATPPGQAPVGNDTSAVEVAQSLLDGGAATVAPNQDPPPPSPPPGSPPPDSPPSGSSVDSVVLPGSEETALSDTASKGNVYWKSVARIGVQIADALDYAHGQGILHRDIKPSNLLLDTQGTVWVTDFGLAKSNDSDDLTHTGQVIGTLRYLPPERLQGKGDHRSDIYSLGLTLYELLTMRPAFGASDHNRLLHQIAHNDPTRPRKRNPEIPRDLETIVLKAIDRDPRRRYATASELGRDLNRFVTGQPIHARRIGVTERAVKLARRHPAVACLLVAVLTMLIVGSAGVFWQWREAESARANADRIAIAERRARLRAEEQTALAVTAKQEATRLADRERQATAAALRAQQAEVAAGRRLQRQLAQLNSEYGIRMLEQDDVFGSLVWFARARELDELALPDEADPSSAANARQRRELHDARLAAVLARCPRLVQAWSLGNATRWVEFDPAGNRIVTATHKGDVRVWDAKSGRPLTPRMAHPSYVWEARFSPDGRLIVTGCGDAKGRIWDAETGALVCELPHKPTNGGYHGVRWVAFRPDGSQVATASLDGSVSVWDPKSGEAVWPRLVEATGKSVNTIEFSPMGDRLLTAGAEGGVQVWNMADGALAGQPIEHAASVRHAAFSPDGKRIVTCWGDGPVRVWDTDSGNPVSPLMQHTQAVLAICFSPDGTKILTAGADRTARIWDAETGESLVRPMMHFGRISRAEFSPDGRYVLTGSADKTARVWDASTGQPVSPFLRHEASVYSIDFSPAGDQVVTGANSGTVRVWDLKTVVRAARFAGGGGRHALATFSADGRFLITAAEDHTVRVWRADSLTPYGKPLPHPVGVQSIEMQFDGKQLLTLDVDRIPRIWNLESGRAAAYQMGGEAKTHLTRLSRDGRFALFVYDDRFNVHDFASGRDVIANRMVNQRYWPIYDALLDPRSKYVAASVPGLCRVWDLETGASRFQVGAYGRTMAASPDGRWLALSGVETLVLDTSTGERVQAIEVASEAKYICFSPQSDHVLMIEPSGIVRIASVATDSSSNLVLPHPDVVYTARFSRDGARVATACEDGVARVWDVRTGERLTPDFRYPKPVLQAEFDRQGERLLTRYADGVVEFWDLPTGETSPHGRLDLLAESLSMQRQAESGPRRLSAAQFLDVWRKVQDSRAVQPAPRWRTRELANCEAEENWFAAEFHVSRMIEEDPNNRQLLLRRGGLRMRLGQTAGARDDFAGAVELGDDGELDVAVEKGDDGVARYQLARAHLRLGELEQAVESLEQVLVLRSQPQLGEKQSNAVSVPAEPTYDPRIGPLWLRLSLVRSALDQPDKAAEAYEHALQTSQAIMLNPTAAWSRRRRGVPTQFKPAWIEVLDDVQQLSEDIPLSRRLRVLGLVHAGLADYASAADAFAKAVELEPEAADLWTALARTGSEQAGQANGREQMLSAWRDVAEYCAKSDTLASGNWTNSCLAARAAMARGDWRQVVAKASQAIKIAPGAFECYYLRGVARRQLRHPDAVADFSRAMAWGANRGQMLYERGLAQLLLGEPQEAEQDFFEAIQAGWNVAPARYYRAVALAKLSRTSDAVAELGKAIQQAPAAEFHLLRATLHLGKRRYPEAEADLLTAAKQSSFASRGKRLPLKTSAYVYLVAARAEQALWDRALQALAVLNKRPEYRRQALYQTALVELAAGRSERYRERCVELAQMLDDADSPGIINQAGWICVVGPDAVDDDSRLLQLVKDKAESERDNGPLQNTLGGMLYRAGDYEAARRQLEKAAQLDGGGTPIDRILMSMVHHQLGDDTRAAELLRKVVQQRRSDAAQATASNSTKPITAWTLRLETDLLIDEATTLLDDAD